MKKVAIMTWYQHRNYGTSLQAVALIHTIKKLGYEPYGIQYYSEGYERETRLEKMLSARKMKDGMRHFIEGRKYPSIPDEEKQKRYDVFMDENIPMETPTQTASQLFRLNEKYDAFICGSDQIWTPYAYNSKYFLDFVIDNKKKIAYAPSFGTNEIVNAYVRDEVGKQVKTFSHLSIREKQGADLLQKYYGLKAEVVLDPTLLVEKNEWEMLSGDTKRGKNTLLCYILGENESNWKYIEKIALYNNLNVRVIPVHNKDYYRKYQVLKGIGPSEFLSEIRNADFICTDSFHGTVFSILYHRPFITFKRFADNDPKSQNSRILNLLEILNAQKHLWNGSLKFAETDWEEVDRRLEKERKKSFDFLRKALESAVDCDRNKMREKKHITNTCCGCGVCVKICPKNAICMEESNGFYQAVVDDDKCINCGLCNKVCAYNGLTGAGLATAKLYEAKSKDFDVLRTSTSGGIAHEITSLLLGNNYPIWSCIFDQNDGKVRHTLLEEYRKDELAKFQGSKYLQSRFFDGNLSILERDKGAIFGTPCQIAAVDNYLRIKNKRNDFVLVDLICHGVPSVDLWRTYLNGEGIEEADVMEAHFRDAKMGWREIYIYVKSSQKEIHRKEEKDLFYHFFDLQSCYMPSCYECNYRTSSKADIRLGDYWGKKYTKEDLKYGVSMVATFTERGNKILAQLKDLGRISLNEQPIKEYYTGQGPVNPVIPLYYYPLIEDLKKNTVNLRILLHKYCYTKYLYKQIQRKIVKLRQTIGRGGENANT